MLEYRFPVHGIGPALQPPAAGTPTFIVVYRDRRDEIGFLELNAASARLLALLQAQPQSGADAAHILARELNVDGADALRAAAMELLATLHRRDVILGTRAQTRVES